MFFQRAQVYLLLFGAIFSVAPSLAYNSTYVPLLDNDESVPQLKLESDDVSIEAKVTDLAADTNYQDESNMTRGLPRRSRMLSTNDRAIASPKRASDTSSPAPKEVVYTTDSNGYLQMLGRVHVQVISRKVPQKVTIRDRSVYINDKLVLENINDGYKLPVDLTYQKRDDGSLWQTNLPVGEPMTREEIEPFLKELREIADRKRGVKQTETRATDDTSSGNPNDRIQTTDSEGYLYMLGRVAAQVISPKGVTQKIRVSGKKAYLNDKLLVEDFWKLSLGRDYQRSADGALWLTNLPVGRAMTSDEKRRFLREIKYHVNRKWEEYKNNGFRDPEETNKMPTYLIDPKPKRNVFETEPTKGYLKFHEGRIRATVISPKVPQKILLQGRDVKVNDRYIRSEQIKVKQSYQVSPDGARWFTNLPVGRAMGQTEIREFEREAKKLQGSKGVPDQPSPVKNIAEDKFKELEKILADPKNHEARRKADEEAEKRLKVEAEEQRRIRETTKGKNWDDMTWEEKRAYWDPYIISH